MNWTADLSSSPVPRAYIVNMEQLCHAYTLTEGIW
jgi:hypothetical protein